jgi:hypothetical protein
MSKTKHYTLRVHQTPIDANNPNAALRFADIVTTVGGLINSETKEKPGKAQTDLTFETDLEQDALVEGLQAEFDTIKAGRTIELDLFSAALSTPIHFKVKHPL